MTFEQNDKYHEEMHAYIDDLYLAANKKPACTMGVGDGTGNLFVHGDYDSIKAAQAIVLENERLRAECEQSSRNLVDAWVVIAENGNIRAWASTRDHPTLKKLESQGCEVVQMVLSPETVNYSLTVSGEAQPPRITEQDAYDIILNFYWYMKAFKNKHGENPSVIEWKDAEGRALLDKLNAGRPDHIAEAGKMIRYELKD